MMNKPFRLRAIWRVKASIHIVRDYIRCEYHIPIVWADAHLLISHAQLSTLLTEDNCGETHVPDGIPHEHLHIYLETAPEVGAILRGRGFYHIRSDGRRGGCRHPREGR